MRDLIDTYRTSSVKVGSAVFPDKSKDGVKSIMKRILAGEQGSLRKIEVENIIKQFDMTWSEFEAFNPYQKNTDHRQALTDSDYEALEALWPGAVEYVRFYAHAIRLGDMRIIVDIELNIANNMAAAAEMLKREALGKMK